MTSLHAPQLSSFVHSVHTFSRDHNDFHRILSNSVTNGMIVEVEVSNSLMKRVGGIGVDNVKSTTMSTKIHWNVARACQTLNVHHVLDLDLMISTTERRRDAQIHRRGED